MWFVRRGNAYRDLHLTQHVDLHPDQFYLHFPVEDVPYNIRPIYILIKMTWQKNGTDLTVEPYYKSSMQLLQHAIYTHQNEAVMGYYVHPFTMQLQEVVPCFWPWEPSLKFLKPGEVLITPQDCLFPDSFMISFPLTTFLNGRPIYSTRSLLFKMSGDRFEFIEDFNECDELMSLPYKEKWRELVNNAYRREIEYCDIHVMFLHWYSQALHASLQPPKSTGPPLPTWYTNTLKC